MQTSGLLLDIQYGKLKSAAWAFKVNILHFHWLMSYASKFTFLILWQTSFLLTFPLFKFLFSKL